MTNEEYHKKYDDVDHVLIRMTDSFPYFKEKVFHSNGRDIIDSSYHFADGVFSCYINFEMPDNGLSAEISGCPQFEITTDDPMPILITNIGTKPFDARVVFGSFAAITPGAIFEIHPMNEIESLAKKTPLKYLSQDEMNRLLNGDV